MKFNKKEFSISTPLRKTPRNREEKTESKILLSSPFSCNRTTNFNYYTLPSSNSPTSSLSSPKNKRKMPFLFINKKAQPRITLRNKIRAIIKEIDQKPGKSSFLCKLPRVQTFKTISSQRRSPNPLITNNSSMNNFIINGFSFSQRKSDVKSLNTQKMMKVSKNFYNFLKEVNEHKTKVSDSEFKSLKRESGTIAPPQTIVTDFEDEKWKRSFMKHLCQTNSKLSEKEFYLFKERLHKDEKNKSEKKAKKFAKLIFSIDSEEYNNKQIAGKGGKVNFGKLNRKIRLYNIMKTGDDEEREGNIIGNIGKFKENKKKINEDIELFLKDIGPPKYLKQKFKKGTVDKYKRVSGEYFGVPV